MTLLKAPEISCQTPGESKKTPSVAGGLGRLTSAPPRILHKLDFSDAIRLLFRIQNRPKKRASAPSRSEHKRGFDALNGG